MKKLAALLLALTLAAACFACFAEGDSPAEASGAVVIVDKWTLRPLGDGAAEIVRLTDTDKDALLIPEELDGLRITAIGDLAFENNRKLKSVQIPAGVTAVGMNPFALCTQLQEITVAENHPTLESRNGVLYSKADARLVACPCALGGDSFTVPEDVRIIGGMAFARNKTLSSVSIPAGVAEIGANPFVLCAKLQEISVADGSPFEIAGGALCGKEDARLICYPCGSAAAAFEIPGNIRTVGAGAFSRCENLVSITVPSGVTRLEDGAFSECTALEEIVLPEGVTEIPARLFSGCLSLAAVSLPDTVTRVGDWAFFGCLALPGVALPDSVAEIGAYAFSHCPALAEITVPDGVSRIGACAFAYCEKLEMASLPASVSEIGFEVFDHCHENLAVIVEEGSFAEQYCKDLRLPCRTE